MIQFILGYIGIILTFLAVNFAKDIVWEMIKYTWSKKNVNKR